MLLKPFLFCALILTILLIEKSSAQADGDQCCESSSSESLHNFIKRVPLPPVETEPSSSSSSNEREEGSYLPVVINVSLHIETMRDIASQVTLDFYMIQKWRDYRIAQIIMGKLPFPFLYHTYSYVFLVATKCIFNPIQCISVQHHCAG